MSGFAPASTTRVAVCPRCHGRNMRLQRRESGNLIFAYWFRCSDCDAVTAQAPTLQQVAKSVQWAPLGSQENEP